MLANRTGGGVSGAVVPERARAPRANTKIRKMIRVLADLGETGLNCFQAANRYGDYVLRSTVSAIEHDYGLRIGRTEERVPNSFGTHTTCVRYRLVGQERERARRMLGLGPLAEERSP